MAIGAVCFIGGFFFWPLFIVAAIMAMTLTATPEELHEAARPKPKAALVERAGIKAEDADWKARFLEACESPAESAFLTAMIDAFSLRPVDGVLKAPGLTLNMQVDMKRYRLDFLANGWLVVEIDGAAWHSSPEAMARDKIRDKFFEGYDYTVLRIPAKTVFGTPQEAVRMVRGALAIGRKAPKQKVVREPVSVMGAVGGFVRGVGEFVEGVNAAVEQASAIQEALGKPQLIYHAEKQAITIAIEAADRKIEVEKFRAQSPQHREMFDANMKRLTTQLNKSRDGKDPVEELRQLMRERISPIEEPKAHLKEEIDEAIKRQFSSLMEERAAFFAETKKKLSIDEARAKIVKCKLLEMGCMTCWLAIAPSSSKARVTIAEILAMRPLEKQTQAINLSSFVRASPLGGNSPLPPAGNSPSGM
ncbi:endonuclease domain-containing protein (plasmid) [Roseomonas mucosa]|nr:endonuclease domain-containing protein [Roseomonas mucosa]USQ74393.1 endonuclease domain-containing protein [Roseomonas mucosa]